MRWWLYGGVATVAAGSIAAVVIAIGSVSSSNDLDRIRSALSLQTNCRHIVVRRPSRATIVKRWAGSTVQSNDVDCTDSGPRVTYAKFADGATLTRVVATSLPGGGYCRLGNAVMLARAAGAASTLLSDMCQSLGGTLVLASSDIAWSA